MNYAHSIKRSDILDLIKDNPGITKQELMQRAGIGIKALEMHLARIAGREQAHSEPIHGSLCRGWFITVERPRVAARSVFDLARAYA